MKPVTRFATALASAALLAACGGGSVAPPELGPGETPMPDVEGMRLDVAKSDLAAVGLEEGRIEVVGGGVLGILDESNWVVCDQRPDPGFAVGAKARLAVDRQGSC